MITFFILFLSLVFLVLLGLLYHYIQNRKIFGCFCLTLALAGAVAYCFAPTSHQSPSLTEEETVHLQQQQQIFAAWYADYQKDITQLDRNWQWYHTILEAFKEDVIDIQTAYVRLNQLEEDSKLLHEQIAQKQPPLALDDTCYDLLIEVMKKTNGYAAAQHKTIALTRAVSDPTHLRTADSAEQNRFMQETMIRESPAGLFTANEISAIRDYLSIPEDE